MNKNGFTLVELLVGMAIAMLCMIMMLTFFVRISRVGGEASRDAEYDAQLETGTLIAQKLMQNAGYGFGRPEDLDITTTSPKAIYWRVGGDPTPSTSASCYGIQETITPNGSNYTHSLNYLTKTSCNTSSTSSSTSLSRMTGWAGQPIVSINSTSADAIFDFALPARTDTTTSTTASGTTTTTKTYTRSPCAPFRLQKETGTKVVITAKRNYISGTGQSLNRAVCLRNLPVPAPTIATTNSTP